MNEQNNQSLITKLFKKLFNQNMAKKASAVLLTAGIMFGGVACSNIPDTTTTTQPNNNQNQNNQNIDQYSQLLQNVLNQTDQLQQLSLRQPLLQELPGQHL